MTVQNKKGSLRVLRQGFTLIELLIVMAILGVLAVVVLVAINPVQQLARTRDAGRKSGITQMGHAMEAYFTTRGGAYPAVSNTWITDGLVSSGELTAVPSSIAIGVSTAGIVPCPAAAASAGVEQGWCYAAQDAAGLEPIIVYTSLESDSEISKCDTAGDIPFFVWSTADGRGGLVCAASGAEPAPPAPASSYTLTSTWNSVQ